MRVVGRGGEGGEAVQYASGLSSEDFEKEVGEERMAAIQAAMGAGETGGALVMLSLSSEDGSTLEASAMRIFYR